MYEIQLAGSTLRVITSGFREDDIEEKLQFVQQFCDRNEVKITNVDRVINSDLHINNTIYTLGPNDTITLARMLTYCGKDTPNLYVFFQPPGAAAEKIHTKPHKTY